MAINPPSDLVMDVARAADPQAYRMAAERLRAPSASGTMVASTGAATMAAPAAGGELTRDNFASFFRQPCGWGQRATGCAECGQSGLSQVRGLHAAILRAVDVHQ